MAPALTAAAPRMTHEEFEFDEPKADNPDAPAVSQWPPAAGAPSREAILSPQTVGTSFKGIGISESGYIPPDTMGDVGPTQILVHSNGRIKLFDKAGNLGALNAADTTFWASVAPGGISDPEVRYDRLSGRWFVLAIDLTATNNKIVIAVSSGPTITGQASFTFYSFPIGTPSPNDATSFCDYPSLGVDANALYTGCNMFTSAGSFRWTSAFVIRKSSVTGGGPIVVTGFNNLTSGTAGPGPYAPRGVDNDDPQATEGYIIGVDIASYSLLQVRRVSSPGGTPTLSGDLSITVPQTSTPLTAPISGSATNLDASDDRIFMASIHKNKLTGVSTLWTAHAIAVTTACVGATSGTTRRDGARWYEIGSLTGTPALVQSGTLCDSASANAKYYIYPSVVETGQGHMALGSTFTAANSFAGVSAAGRLRTDTSGSTQAATTVLSGLATYRILDTGSRNRWGDYSFTDVDPTDDQTIWTFQEYSDTPANNWSVRAVQLKAPPPATPTSASPSAICTGLSSVSVTVTGTSASGSEFFDPGADTGGPGFANRIAASLAGGTPPTVNSVAIVVPGSPSTTPVTQVTLSLNTTSATTGTKTVTVTNPDGQAATSASGIITVNAPAGAPTAGNNGQLCAGATLQLTASTIAGATYSWTGPNGFTSGLQNPTITNVTTAAAGTYSVTATTVGCAAGPAGTTVVTIIGTGQACNDGALCTSNDICVAGGTCAGTAVVCTALDQCHVAGTCNPATGTCSNPNAADGAACNDGNGCTQTDTCQGGACTGANPVTCTALDQCHVAGTCNPATGTCSNPYAADGAACNDGNGCTQADTCQGGACTGANPVACTALDQCHVAGTCNPATGTCSDPAKPDGTACDDTLACNGHEVCSEGACTAGVPVDCSDGSACSLDLCVEPAGSCDHSQASGMCDILGTILYYRNGSVPIEPSAYPVPGAPVLRTSTTEPTATAFTDAAGKYQFLSEAGNIGLIPQSLVLTDEAECAEAISAADASLMARVAIRTYTPTPNQALAGDVSGNGRVTSYDAGLTAQKAIAPSCIAYRFPVRVSSGSDWAFQPAARNFTPLYGGEDYNFVGLLWGDITGNWTPPALAAPAPELIDPSVPQFPRASAAASGVPGSSAAELYLASGPDRTADGHWKAVLGLQNADGILGLDLALAVDPAVAQIRSVAATGIASTFGLYGNNAGSAYLIAMYNAAAMQGSGEFLVVTYDLTTAATGSLPFGVNAAANEGLIPVALGQGIPRPGTHDPEVQVDQQ